jgi:hypothetical protein
MPTSLRKRLSVVRPTFIAALAIAALVFSSEIAWGGQLHGGQLLKGCVQGKKVCGANTDCPDASSCSGQGICTSTLAERTTQCTFTFTDVDGFGDSLRILSTADAIRPGIGETLISGIPISAVSGTTTCTVAGPLPCDIAAGASVSFLENTYVIQPSDPNPLPDQARLSFMDLCDAVGTLGCSSTVVVAQASAATNTISGCAPGPTCTATPTGTPPNTPTETATPTNTQTPPEVPPPTVPTLSFPMMALLGLLLAGAGLFLARRH